MNDDNSTLARERLLVPAGLDDTQLQSAFDALLSHDIDAADIYFQAVRFESWFSKTASSKKACTPSNAAWGCGR